MQKAEEKLPAVLAAYDFGECSVEVVRYGSGHINDTFCVHAQPKEGEGKRFILQRLSPAVFPKPYALMENVVNVTEHLRRKLEARGEDSERSVLRLVMTKDGKPCYTDDAGSVWRATYFVEDTICLQSIQDPRQFYAAARAFGKFQRLLGDFPAHTLHEVIERFHDTEYRLASFRKALHEDNLHRAARAKPETDFILARAEDCSVCMQALRDGALPLRVTHNDTKLSNVLLDKHSGAGICVIDLDTVMPGLSVNDFGDSIRSGANRCAEDARDLRKVQFDLHLYEIYAKGFLEEAAEVLTEAELAYLPWGAKLMTLECGMRFLTDYLQGDVYFHTEREGQNLDRCRTQLKLVADMEENWQQMHDIIAALSGMKIRRHFL